MGQSVENGRGFVDFLKSFPMAEMALSLRREFLRDALKKGLPPYGGAYTFAAVEKASPLLAEGRRNLPDPGMIYQPSEAVAQMMAATGPVVVKVVRIVKDIREFVKDLTKPIEPYP